VVNAIWRVGTRIKEGVADLVRRIGDDQTQVGYSMVGQLGGRYVG
jgi:hypothetical protein